MHKRTKTFVTLSLFFLSTLTFGGFYPDDPEKFNQKIEKQIAFHVKFAPDVYYLGDDHKIDQTREYEALLAELKKQDPEVNCLLLEASRRHIQPVIEEYVYFRDFSVIEEKMREVASWYGVEVSPVKLKEKKVLIDTALKLRMRIFAIDKLPTPSTIETLVDMYKEANDLQDIQKLRFAMNFEKYHYGVKRNRIMAQRMNELLKKDQSCKRVVSVNGFEHLQGKEFLKSFSVWYEPMQLLANDKYDISFRIIQSL